ncbi:MAG: IclR family transcriptional regulator [Betaproteobacteria bacterium]|nr:MAG: IclR family transcriptional regulator [Betaproteobacteria bacterium]
MRTGKRLAVARKAAKPEGARTVGRVLRALELLAGQGGPLRLMEIARELGIPTSSAHALVQQLIRFDYVKTVGEERRYVAGPALVLLGTRVRAGLQIVKVARSVLEELAAATGENVYLGIRQAHGIVYADSIEAESGVMARFPIGSMRPLHASSPGKVFLAFQVPPVQLDAFLGPGPLQAFTRHTITDRVRLRQQLDQVRARGYAVNEQEAVEGAFGVSAPIFGADGALAGSITLGLPVVRYKSGRDMAIRKVTAAATEISRRLGVESWSETLRSFSRPLAAADLR